MSSMEATDVGEAYCTIKGQNWMLSDEEKNVHREGATNMKMEEGKGEWDGEEGGRMGKKWEPTNCPNNKRSLLSPAISTKKSNIRLFRKLVIRKQVPENFNDSRSKQATEGNFCYRHKDTPL